MDLSTEKTLRVISYTKESADGRYAGGGFDSGYHTIDVRGETFSGQRNNKERLSQVDFDFKNKVVLDLGCNMGGMLHQLAGDIRHGVGVDFDPKCINAANLIATVNKTDNLKFFVFDLEKENIYRLWNFIPNDRVDVCCFLALCCWVDNWKDIIDFCAKISDILFFETNAYPEDLKKSSIEYVKSLYADVRVISSTSDDDPITQGRVSLWCSNTPFRFADALEELATVENSATEVRGIEPLESTGCQRKAYRIRGGGKDYFLGVGGQRNWADYAASKFLRKQESSVVDTIVCSEDRSGTPYIIREYIEANTLAKYDLKNSVMNDVLRKISAIHGIKANGYGFIGEPSPDGDLFGTSNTWIDFLQFLVTNEGEFLRNKGIIANEEYEEMVGDYSLYFKKFRNCLDLDSPGRCLFGDIGWSNILIDDSGKAFFTDFEFALIGDPAFEFSCMWDYYGKPLAYYLKEQQKRDISFAAGAFRKKLMIYEPMKMLFVASYANARNGRNATARYQFDYGMNRLSTLVHGPLLSYAWNRHRAGRVRAPRAGAWIRGLLSMGRWRRTLAKLARRAGLKR